MSLLFAALLMVGLSFGEASAIPVQFDFTGYVIPCSFSPFPSYTQGTVTGYFQYDPAAYQTGGGTTKTYNNIPGSTLSITVVGGGKSFYTTVFPIDVQINNNTVATGIFKPSIDSFIVSSEITATTVNVFNLTFQNKLGTTIQTDLLQTTSLPGGIGALKYIPGGLSSTNEYTEGIGIFNLNSIKFQFAVTNLTEHASGPATPVPEPATMFLLGSGLIGVGVYARKRFKK